MEYTDDEHKILSIMKRTDFKNRLPAKLKS